MFDKSLCPQQLEEISDDVLDALITEQAEEHLDPEFRTLGEEIAALGRRDLHLTIEELVTAFSIKVAEQAFRRGHEHGYVWAAFDMVEELRPLGFAN